MSSDSSRIFSIYRTVKIKINHWMDNVIHFCDRKLLSTEKIRNDYLRFCLQRLAFGTGNLALFIQQLPRSEAYELQSRLGKVIFVGNESGIPYFTQKILVSNDAHIEYLGRYSLGTLPSQTEKWFSEGAQMVAIVLSPFHRQKFHSAFIIEIPYLIRQVMSLQEPLDLLVTTSKYRGVRKYLKRIRSKGIELRFSKKQEDFDLFYHRMYLPYTADRHGEMAWIKEYDDLWNFFSKGGLIMFYRGSEPVAGSLVMTRGNVGFGIVGGVLDGNRELLQAGIFTMIMWESGRWAQNQGMEYFDLGTSNPLRSDGVFRFKNTFRPRVERYYYRKSVNQMSVRNGWTLLMQNPSTEFLQTLEQVGLIVENQKKIYGVALVNGVQEQMPEIYPDKLKDASDDGLSGLAIFSPHQVVYLDVQEDKNPANQRQTDGRHNN